MGLYPVLGGGGYGFVQGVGEGFLCFFSGRWLYNSVLFVGAGVCCALFFLFLFVCVDVAAACRGFVGAG